MLFTTVTVAVVCVMLYVIYARQRQDTFQKHGVLVPPTLPIIGCYELFIKGVPDGFLYWRKKYGKLFGIYSLGQCVWVVSDADMIKEIMIRSFGHFVNRRPTPTKDVPVNTKGILTLRNQRWKDVRNLLTPAFSGNKMKKIAIVVNEACDTLVHHFREKSKEPFIQCKELFGSFAMDTLSAAFYGLKVDSQKNGNDPFIAHAKEGFNFRLDDPKVILVSFFPKIGKIFDLFDIGLMPSRTRKFFMRVMEDTIKMRKGDPVKRTDILQMMIDAHDLHEETDDEGQEKSENISSWSKSSTAKQPLEMDEIMANTTTFFVAGYETTNTALCYMAYALATHPEVQDKLIAEVDEKAPTRTDVKYDIMLSMEYLDCFVLESLRKYPPVLAIERQCNETFTYNDITITDKEAVMVPIYAVHHDAEYWPEPEKFDPERFNKEKRANNHPSALIPFGHGPRNCLGMRLAMMEIKFSLVRLLQEFRFVTCADTAIPPVLGKAIFLMPDDGIKLQVEPREKKMAESDK